MDTGQDVNIMMLCHGGTNGPNKRGCGQTLYVFLVMGVLILFFGDLLSYWVGSPWSLACYIVLELEDNI